MRTSERYKQANSAKKRTANQFVRSLVDSGIGNETYKISLNDQLEVFYDKVRDNQLLGHEIAYYFHTELLSPKEFAACHAAVKLKESQKEEIRASESRSVLCVSEKARRSLQCLFLLCLKFMCLPYQNIQGRSLTEVLTIRLKVHVFHRSAFF